MPCTNPPEHCGCTHAAARARCATWTDWCAPGDRQEDVWLIRFDDNDVNDKIYSGPDAEREARLMWEGMCGPNGQWNGYLFRLAQTPPDSGEGQ